MDLFYEELLKIPHCHVEYNGDPGALQLAIKGFSTDSRTIKFDEIFLVLSGEKFDGHLFISDIRSAGIKNFVVSESWYNSANPSQIDGNFFVVSDTLVALQEIGRYYRSKFDIPLIALTGSNGKTTTKEMIASALSEKYNILKNKGNLNNHIGVPQSLLELTNQHEIAVIEMGTNHFGEIARLAEIAKPTAGLITNIGPAHLEFLGSLEGVYRAKSELWQYLEQQDNRIAFVNVDDPFLAKHKFSGVRCVTYGFTNPADVQGQFLKLDEAGRPAFKIEGVEISLGIVGMHNITNALAAVVVGLEYGLSITQIKISLEKFLPSSKRMEIIQKNGITVINDCYNSNPESARKSILTLSQVQTTGKRIAILADMLELGEWAEKEHQGIGEYIASIGNVDYLLTYGPLSRWTGESAQKISKIHATHFENKKELIEFVKRLIKKEDVLLVKGSRGMAMEEVTNGLFEA